MVTYVCCLRISEQAQRRLEDSTIFEDLSLGANRPTQLIRRYQELYSQGRVDIIDILEEQGLDEDQRIAVPLDIMQVILKSYMYQLFMMYIYVYVKMSFTVVESTLEEISANWKKALFLTEQVSGAASQLEKAVNAYLRKDCNPHKLPLLQVLIVLNASLLLCVLFLGGRIQVVGQVFSHGGSKIIKHHQEVYTRLCGTGLGSSCPE